MRFPGIWLVLFIGCFLSLHQTAAGDTYIITLDSVARTEPANGRVILFFITKEGRRWQRRQPMDAPFFDDPQPIASIAVEHLKPGESVKIDGNTPAFPHSLDKLQGKVRVQAVLDLDQTERSHDAGPGNVYSEVVTVDLSSKADETINIALTKVVEKVARGDQPHLKWIEFRSESLSEFYGRDVFHRAGVALPKGYNDPNWPQQQWPAIYVIPGFGGREEAAAGFMRRLHTEHVQNRGPNAVYIVLDPEAPLGHHGFCDSANNGPRGTALIQEFIPYLESQFRLVAKPEARIVTGHSSGGWASLWLQLQYPDSFGACWSSAPDPIDFSAFQMTDLYADVNMFTDAEGDETPSYRQWGGAEVGYVNAMTVRQEVAMEHAIDPDGRSGQQWATWNSMFSSRRPDTGLPLPMFDAMTGEINKQCVRLWGRYDIARLMQNHWEVYGPIVLSKVRLVCGDKDSYFLNRAVERFRDKVEHLKAEFPQHVEGKSGGYILIVPEADHSSVIAKTFVRWNQEMLEYLKAQGF